MHRHTSHTVSEIQHSDDYHLQVRAGYVVEVMVSIKSAPLPVNDFRPLGQIRTPVHTTRVQVGVEEEREKISSVGIIFKSVSKHCFDRVLSERIHYRIFPTAAKKPPEKVAGKVFQSWRSKHRTVSYIKPLIKYNIMLL